MAIEALTAQGDKKIAGGTLRLSVDTASAGVVTAQRCRQGLGDSSASENGCITLASHRTQGALQFSDVTEVQSLISHLLVTLMTFAGDQHAVTRGGGGHRQRDGTAPRSGSPLVFAADARQDVVDDLQRRFVPRVVTGDNDAIRQLVGRRPISGRLSRSRSPPQPNTQCKLPGGVCAQCAQGLGQRIRCMGIVDHQLQITLVVDVLHATVYALELRNDLQCPCPAACRCRQAALIAASKLARLKSPAMGLCSRPSPQGV